MVTKEEMADAIRDREFRKEFIGTFPHEEPPMRLALDPKSPDFHPCYVRVGVRVDGHERKDIAFYDVAGLSYMTERNTSHLAISIEPYWRYSPSRQQRRYEERWEKQHGKK